MDNDKIPLEYVLQRINKYVSLKDEDRSKYTQDFNAVFLAITLEMVREDPVFESLYNGPQLGGSYADRLKVSKPDEFDLVLRLKIKANNYVKIERVKKRPGYVQINLTDVFDIIKNQTQHKVVYAKLLKLVNAQNYLVQNKLQRWIESIMTKVLLKNNNKFTRDGKTYCVKYAKTGPAHTITLTTEDRFMSIDLVPAIVFDKTKWLAARSPPNGAITDWFAVPKPVKDTNGENIAFQTSYVDTERFYINRKNNFKNTLRMIKKLRDRYNIQNLKSYFIKTVFLWENEKQPSEFWDGSAGKILLHMLNILLQYIEKGKMPFFWDENENMFGNFSNFQLITMHGQLNSIYKSIVKFSTTNTNKLYEIFLTREEIEDMKKEENIAEKLRWFRFDDNENTAASRNDSGCCIV